VRRARSLILGLATATVLVGCAGNQPTPGQATDSSPGAGQTTSSSHGAGHTAGAPEQLRFAAKTLDGKDFSGESLAGRAAVLWFWTPWCPKCQAEAPGVAGAAQANVGKVEFVGVAAQDKLPAMQGFVSTYGVGSFQHLADFDGSIWRRFDVIRQPAYAFISPDGSVEVVKDQLSETELADRVGRLAAA